MKTKREEKMEKELSACKKALHQERQKNRDLSQSREKYKVTVKRLKQELKATETVKKNGKSDCPPKNILQDINTLISLFH
jgi:septal ring factor EnvC (AmiA/AmiB activator)